MNTPEENIYASKCGFEAAFAEKSFYDRQTQDSSHIESIIDILPIKNGMSILDLGTGSGYLAFALANRYPDVSFTGLDIVEKALEQNRKRTEQEGLKNLIFSSYDGISFPFEKGSFDMVVSRYSLHHFPDIHKSLSEVHRVLADKGCFFISDPSPNENDTSGFVDKYMQLKPDGHIRFYTLAEWNKLCREHDFRLEASFASSLCFPRKTGKAYEELLRSHPKETAEGYGIRIVGDEIFITEQVNNILFRKNSDRTIII
ncbi:MAG: class I SAM-dependent methyltransferase [Ruminococcus sp.]|nr:class I SAM-dependent methyltransferase [Ruminococcus sp.]